MRPWIFLLILGLALAPSTVLSQRIEGTPSGQIETGMPPFVFFSPEAIGLQTPPTDIKPLTNAQGLPDGRVLVVGETELCIGDGTRWQVIPRASKEPNNLLGRLAINKGDLFASVYQGFCQIKFDSKGCWYMERVDKNKTFPEVSALGNCRRINGHWYWYSTTLAQWDLDPAQPPKILAENLQISHLFRIGDDLYLPESMLGSLKRLKPDMTLEDVLTDQKLDPGSAIVCSSSLNKDAVIVGTTSRGMLLFDGKNFRPFSKNPLLSGSYRINDMCHTLNGQFAAAIEGVGLVFFDESGRVLQVLDRKADSRLGQLNRIFWTPDYVLWAHTNSGIVRVNYPSRISYMDSMIHCSMDYMNPVRHKGRLWLLSTGNVLRSVMDADSRLIDFEKDAPPPSFTFSLTSTGEHLIAGTNEGFFERTESAWVQICPLLTNGRLIKKDESSDRWLYAARNEIGWITFTGSGAELQRKIIPKLGDVFNTLLDDKGRCWLELGMNRIALLNLRSSSLETEIFTLTVERKGGWVEVFELEDGVHVRYANQVFRLNEKTRAFEGEQDQLDKHPELRDSSGGRPTMDKNGRLWVPDNDRVRVFDHREPGIDPVIEELPPTLKPKRFICADDGVVWLQGKLSFARYDPSVPLPKISELRAIITRVELPGSGRNLIFPEKLGILEPNDNSFIAHFSATGTPVGENATIEILLEGQSDQWMPTGLSGSAIFNKLKHGDYTLHVRPRTAKLIGEEARLTLTILPPWYETKLAYLGYGLAIVGFLSIGFALPLRFSKRRREKMERLVLERTRALKASEERYRTLNSELEQRVATRTADLDQTAFKLSAANRELESFAYSISHDLKAPLRNIMGFMQLLEQRMRKKNDHDCDHYMDVVISETKRLSSLIENLLGFSRIGKAELHMQTVDLAAAVRDFQRESAVDTRGRNIEWRIGSLPLAEGDPALLHQVIANLVGNSIKFTRNRPTPIIDIYCLTNPDPDGRLVFVVKDNGAGFNPKYSDKLFGVFQRLHSERSFEGTGIGLANVKRIISRHGGRVWAEGRLDEGASFFFTLKPAKPSSRQTTAPFKANPSP